MSETRRRFHQDFREGAVRYSASFQGAAAAPPESKVHRLAPHLHPPKSKPEQLTVKSPAPPFRPRGDFRQPPGGVSPGTRGLPGAGRPGCRASCPGHWHARVERLPGDGVERVGLRQQCPQRVHAGKRQPGILPGAGGLVLDADSSARHVRGGEQPGELAVLHDAVVPIDTAGRISSGASPR